MSDDLLARMRALIGTDYEPVAHDVTRLDVRRFCFAIGETGPVHHDLEAARAAGHPDLLAPASFYASLGFAGRSLVGRGGLGADGLPLEPALEGARVVAGSTRVRFPGQIHAGDRIVVRQRLADVYGKQGRSGALVFLVYERSYERASGQIVVNESYERVVRR